MGIYMSSTDDKSMSFLNELYKNAEMGINAINTLTEKAEDDNLKKELSTQLHKFRSMEAEIEREIQSRGMQADSSSAVGRMGLRTSVKMNLMMDKTPSHIAQMMIEGANMGMIDLNRTLNKNPEADAQVKKLADKLLQTEQASMDVMKKFL